MYETYGCNRLAQTGPKLSWETNGRSLARRTIKHIQGKTYTGSRLKRSRKRCNVGSLSVSPRLSDQILLCLAPGGELRSHRLRYAAICVALMAARGAADPISLDPRSARADEFFGLAKIYTFHLTIAAADFQRMSPVGARGGPYTEAPATLQFQDRDWGAVTVRYKGNSSFKYAPGELKRSLKVTIDSSDKGRTFFGMSKLNLNNNAFDQSQMREALAYDVFRRANVPAPRTAFARVFITVPGIYARQYVGLFTVVEEIDRKFFEDRWGRQVGFLVKPTNLKGMPFLGDDWERYQLPYGSRIRPNPGDIAQFIALAKLLNQAPDDEFGRRVGDHLDVEAFLRFLACEVVLVNTDSPLATSRNYWMTVHPGTRKIVWVPWDMNMAFAGFQPSDAELSLHSPTVAGAFPLAERILANKGMAAKYDQIVREIVTTNFTVARIGQQITAIDSVTGAAAAAEPDTIASKAPPLRQFVADRVQAVIAQLNGTRPGSPARGPGATSRTNE
jgi:spore coat protein CotH